MGRWTKKKKIHYEFLGKALCNPKFEDSKLTNKKNNITCLKCKEVIKRNKERG